MKLYPEHIAKEPTLEAVEWLDQQGYNCEIKETRIVESSDREKAYVVQRVETTKVPFERADVVEDTQEYILCSCDSARYHSFTSVDVEKSLDGHSPCKHSRVFREQKAQDDPNQAIFDVGQ